MPCGVLAVGHLPVDVPRRYVRFLGSPDMADYAPRLVYDANDPDRTQTGWRVVK
jgi:hypothetical protein